MIKKLITEIEYKIKKTCKELSIETHLITIKFVSVNNNQLINLDNLINYF